MPSDPPPARITVVPGPDYGQLVAETTADDDSLPLDVLIHRILREHEAESEEPSTVLPWAGHTE